jgi:CheY-like chemotaxis protein
VSAARFRDVSQPRGSDGTTTVSKLSRKTTASCPLPEAGIAASAATASRRRQNRQSGLLRALEGPGERGNRRTDTGFGVRVTLLTRSIDFRGEIPYIRYTQTLESTMDQKKIIYVDDDTALRDIVRDQLIANGYHVDEAEDGGEAIEKLERNHYDVMLLDINMPNKSGLDVLKFLKDHSLKCKVIMLTGRVGFGVATESLKLGADDYITKPFNLEYLLFSIKRVLEK